LGKRKDQDGFLQKLTELIDNFLGENIHALINVKFVEIENKNICWIKIEDSPYPVYLDDGNEKKFYIRTQNSSKEIYGDQADKYKQQRF
jgi:predicted HTH transcriptional regulator